MLRSRINQDNGEEIDRWGIVKNWFYDNQADIILIFGVILVAIISFGLGRLTMTTQTAKEPVVIENQGASVLNSMEQTVNQDNGGENKPSANQNNNTLSSEKGIIVASQNGTKYYWPWCSGVSKIKPENLIWFKSEAEAKTAGYTPCSDFTKQSPVGYKPQ